MSPEPLRALLSPVSSQHPASFHELDATVSLLQSRLVGARLWRSCGARFSKC